MYYVPPKMSLSLCRKHTKLLLKRRIFPLIGTLQVVPRVPTVERLCHGMNLVLSTHRSAVSLYACVASIAVALTRQGASWIPSLKFFRSQSTSCEVKTAQVAIKASFVV